MGGRAVEGARLESVYTGNRIVGSNPTPSARSRDIGSLFRSKFKKSIKHTINCKLAGRRQRETDLETQWKGERARVLVSLRRDTGEVPDSIGGNGIIYDTASDRRAPISTPRAGISTEGQFSDVKRPSTDVSWRIYTRTTPLSRPSISSNITSFQMAAVPTVRNR